MKLRYPAPECAACSRNLSPSGCRNRNCPGFVGQQPGRRDFNSLDRATRIVAQGHREEA